MGDKNGIFMTRKRYLGSQNKRRGQVRRGNMGTDRRVDRETGGRGRQGAQASVPHVPA